MSPDLLDQAVVLIPAYNEQLAIESVVKGCLEHTPHVMVVNDGSTDQTPAILDTLPVTVINNKTNKGKSDSLVDGILAAKERGYKYVITLDGDGQHNPHDIPRLLAAAKTHPKNLIIAARLRKTNQAPSSRLLANCIANFFISWAAGQKLLDTQSGFRLYPTSVTKLFHHYSKNKTFVFESELLICASNAGYQISAIAIDSCYPKQARASYFKPGRDIKNITTMVAFHIISKVFAIPGLLKVLFSKGHVINS